MSATDAARKTFCRIDKATKALHPDVRPWDSPSAPAWERARAAYALAVEMEQAEYLAREQEARKGAAALYAQATAAASLAPRPASQSPLGAAEERFCGARP